MKNLNFRAIEVQVLRVAQHEGGVERRMREVTIFLVMALQPSRHM